METRIIAVSNGKGGIAKTTTAINIGIGLALEGRKVLVMDTDTQGDVMEFVENSKTFADNRNKIAKEMGINPIFGLYDYVIPFIFENELEIEFEDAVHIKTLQNSALNNYHNYKNGNRRKDKKSEIHILAGSGSLAKLGTAIKIEVDFSPQYVLTEAMESPENNPVVDRYDYIIIDTSAKQDMLNMNVLFFANELLIPIQLEDLSMKKTLTYLKKLKRILQTRKREGNPLKISYVLPTMVDNRYATTRDFLKSVTNMFNKMFPSTKILKGIPTDSNIKYATTENLSIFEYAPNSKGTKFYKKAVKQIIKDEN